MYTPEEVTVELEFTVTPIFIPETNSRLLIIDNLQFILEASDQSDSSHQGSTKNSPHTSIDMFGHIHEPTTIYNNSAQMMNIPNGKPFQNNINDIIGMD